MLNLITVGKLAGVYGIKGWLKVFSYTEPLDNILLYKPWLLRFKDELREIIPLQGKRYGKGLIVQLPGYETPEIARTLVNTEIAITREQLPALPEGEYYWTDLEGLTVVNHLNITLGKVKEVIATGVNDVLIVEGEKRHLIPYLMQKTILSIDLKKQFIVVEWAADF